MKKLYSKNTAIIIITLIIILVACKKTVEDNLTTPPPVTIVTASVAGSVTDINNAPVSGALVEAGASNTTTDANGQFTLINIQLDKDAGFVKVTKAGYFTGSRTFLVTGNTTNNIKIQMIPKTVSGTIASNSGGNIDVTGGAKINFTASSFVNAASNTAYSGDVAVAGYYLNPADANFREYMPGDLRGISTTNTESILKSFGMLSVEMNDAGGQKLQLATGKTATITIPIPAAMQAAAPATLSLWYFDETKGIWKEEGTANKQSTNYVGTVSHFSFWTAGVQGADIQLDATFKNDTTGLFLTNKLVAITSVNFGTTRGYTDNTGKISGLVPANETLTMRLYNDCGAIIYTKNIGPFSTATNLGIANVTGGNLFVSLVTSTITGNVVNCANEVVARGSAQLTFAGNTYKSVVTNGNFGISFTRCSNSTATAELIVYDSVKNQLGTSQIINITGGAQNVGQIIVCAPSTSPIAGFTYTASGPAAPVTITFTNTSINTTSWVWDFGDGTTSAQQNPVHVYTNVGDYYVKLSATGNGITDTTAQIIHIGPVTTNNSFITLILGGITYSWASPDSIIAIRWDSSIVATPSTQIQGMNINFINFYILTGNASPGNYNISLSAILSGISYPNNNATTVVTGYGVVGGYVTGTASGQMKQQDSTTNIPFTMSYKVKREL